MTRMKKRGSLELSINAIVVLVLAITMLGLGIAFTKGKFSEIGSKIEIPEPDIPATAGDPIVTPSKEITVSTKKDTVFSVNIYNDGGLPASPTTTTPQIGCLCTDAASTTLSPTAYGQVIPNGEDRSFKIPVPKIAPPLAGGDSCLCTIKIYDSGVDTGNVVASKQITFKIR